MFRGSLDELGRQASELVPRLSPASVKAVRRSAGAALFAESDVAREAVRIAQSSRASAVTPASFTAACRRGVPRILESLGVPW